MHKFACYSFAVTTAFCLMSFSGAIGQVLKGEAPGYDAAKGRALYTANCSACHQAGGEGLSAAFPPIKGSGGVNKNDPTKHLHVLLAGMQGAKVGGILYATTIAPFAAMLSDAEITDIIDYERSSRGNHGKPVTAAQVAVERAISEGTEHL